MGTGDGAERRVAAPLVDPDLLRDPRRVAALALMACVVAGQLSMFYLVVQDDQVVLGFGPMASGLAILPLALAIFAVSRVSPRLVARFGQAPLLMVGTTGLAVSFVWLSQVGTTSTYATMVLGPMVLNGLSAGLAFMPITSLAMAGVAPEQAGSASGLLQTVQQLGGAVGIAVIVSVYAAGARPGQLVPGLEGAFLTSATFALVGLAVATTLWLRTRAPRTAAAPGLAVTD